MLRVIQELRPVLVVGENVAAIVSMALDQVLSDLEGIDYATQAFIIPACAVDAPHRRDRRAILAHTKGKRCDHGNDGKNEREANREINAFANAGLSFGKTAPFDRAEFWPTEPHVGRVAYGISSRVDRLKCLGNAVVPQQFYPIFKAIAEMEGGDNQLSIF